MPKASKAPADPNFDLRLLKKTGPVNSSTDIEKRLRNLIASAPDAIIAVDGDQRVSVVNSAAEKMFGYPAKELLGRSFSSLLPIRDREGFEKFVRSRHLTLPNAIETQGPAAIRCLTRWGEEFDAEVSRSWNPVDPQAEVVVILRNITARKVAERARALHSAIVSTSADAIISITADGITETWNKGAEVLFGYESAQVLGKPYVKFLSIGNCPFEQARSSGEIIRTESVLQTKSKTDVDVAITTTPMRSPEGEIIGVSAIMANIGERKKREEQIRFIMMELSHRAKNLMAVILSMAQSTAATCENVEEFEDRFSCRVRSLAHSHDLLLRQEWSGACLKSLIGTQLAPFAERGQSRYTAKGPSILLKPQAAQMVGLALHELATNATKYGAISAPGGSVAIEWSIEIADDGSEHLRLIWLEKGGPHVVAPARRGFGFMVIEEMVASTLDAAVSLNFHPQGVVWLVDAPPGTWLRGENV